MGLGARAFFLSFPDFPFTCSAKTAWMTSSHSRDQKQTVEGYPPLCCCFLFFFSCICLVCSIASPWTLAYDYPGEPVVSSAVLAVIWEGILTRVGLLCSDSKSGGSGYQTEEENSTGLVGFVPHGFSWYIGRPPFSPHFFLRFHDDHEKKSKKKKGNKRHTTGTRTEYNGNF